MNYNKNMKTWQPHWNIHYKKGSSYINKKTEKLIFFGDISRCGFKSWDEFFSLDPDLLETYVIGISKLPEIPGNRYPVHFDKIIQQGDPNDH